MQPGIIAGIVVVGLFVTGVHTAVHGVKKVGGAVATKLHLKRAAKK